MILAIRTDNPEAEVGLFGSDGHELAYEKWQAHRALSETIHVKIKKLLDAQSLNWAEITGIVFYQGPGSFTGLRIGASVANVFGVPVSNQSGKKWIEQGVRALNDGEHKQAVPLYGSDPYTTGPKK